MASLVELVGMRLSHQDILAPAKMLLLPSPFLASSSSLILRKNIAGRSFSTCPEVGGEKM